MGSITTIPLCLDYASWKCFHSSLESAFSTQAWYFEIHSKYSYGFIQRHSSCLYMHGIFHIRR